MALTVMPREATSSATERVKPMIPAFAAEWIETLEGDDLQRLLGPAEGREPPPEPSAPPPEDAAGAGAGEDLEAEPMGRPGLAWGQSSAAPPSGGG